MNALDPSFVDLVEKSRKNWEQTKILSSLDEYGLYSARYLGDDPNRHWFCDENKEWGTAAVMIFAYCGSEAGDILINALFRHLDNCHKCLSGFSECEKKFNERVLSCSDIGDNQTFSDFQRVLFEVTRDHWVQRVKQLIETMNNSPNDSVLASLAICFQALVTDYRYFPDLNAGLLQPQSLQLVNKLAEKGYRWLPGYLVLLFHWNNDKVSSFLINNIAGSKLPTPGVNDMAGFYYVLDTFNAQHPLASEQSSQVWNNIWKTMALYFSALEDSPNTTKMAVTGTDFMEKAASLQGDAVPAIEQFALKGADLRKITRQYCRVDGGKVDENSDQSMINFFNIIKAKRPDHYLAFLMDLLKERGCPNSLRAGNLALCAFSSISDSDAYNLFMSDPATILRCLAYHPLGESLELENAIKQALKQGSRQVLHILKSVISDRGRVEEFPNMPLVLRCIRNFAFLPVFLGGKEESPSSQDYTEFDVLIKSILEQLAACSPTFVTLIAREIGTLSTLWLYGSSTDAEAAELARSILSRIETAKIDATVAIQEACNLMGYIQDRQAYALAAGQSMKEVEKIIDLVCAVGDESTSTLFWDKCWDYISFVWSAGKPPLRVSVEQAKQCLKAATECADKLTKATHSFLVQFNQDMLKERLQCLAAALVPGGELLRLFRRTGILKPAYDVVCAILAVLNSHNFPIPSEGLDVLKPYFVAKHGNELEESETKMLRYLAGADKQKEPTHTLPAVPRAVTSATPSRAFAPDAAPHAAASSTSLGQKTSIKSFFQTVPRETAVAATQKQAPPPPPLPPKPKEGSRLALIREELDSKRKSNPVVPKSIPNNVVIHPARPSGFNKKDKPAAPSSANSGPTRPNPSVHVIDSDDSSSEEESGRGDGLIALHKRKRNIDTERFSNITFQKRLRPPQHDEAAHEAARMRARKAVTADEFHKSVLAWEFYSSGNFPPELVNHRTKVPDVFASPEEYVKIMKPLLLMEVWQQIQQYRDSRRELNDITFALTIGKRTNVDDFIDFNVTVSLDKFTEMHLGEHDLILMALVNPQYAKNTREPANPKPHCYAKVKEGSITVHHKQKQVDLTLRTYKAEGFTKCVNQKLPVTGEKIISLLTAEREYKALQGFEHCELRRQVLNAEPAARVTPNENVVSQLTQQMGLNHSQAMAAYQALSSTGFNLIQGPPGTGKTKTILSIIGAFFSNPSNKRILVCAPSNAAVDELLARIKVGTKNLQGSTMNLKAVRLGRPDTVHPSVVDLCLDRQIESAVIKKANAVDNTLRDAIQELRDKKQALHLEFDEADPNAMTEDQRAEIAKELGAIHKELNEKNKLLAAQREQLDFSRRERELEYRRVQCDILSQAQVVCCTLSGSASNILSSLEIAFKTVIIDEAAQSVELSALIPFRYGCNQCIMVGDPHQLPPTVLNKAAADLDYEQSLFTRIFKQHQDKVSMLDEQFRMHPDIAVFPSKQFYSGLLKTGPGMTEKTTRAWHESPIFRPYYFYNVKDGTHKKSSRSLVNMTEVEAACKLVISLFQKYPQVDFTDKIGIVSPYKQQVNSLKRYFETKLGSSVFDSVTFSTIDAFQGQEKDIIIFSTVRASPDSSTIGFVGDIRRMNVAITRARASLWILGSASTLRVNSEWAKLITDAQERRLFATAKLHEFCSGLVACQQAAMRIPLPSVSGPSHEYSRKKGKHGRREREQERRYRDGSRSSKHSRSPHDSRDSRDSHRSSYDNREWTTPEYRDSNGRRSSSEHNASSPARAHDNERNLPPLPPPPFPPESSSATVATAPSPQARPSTPPVAGGPYRTHAKSSVFITKAGRKS